MINEDLKYFRFKHEQIDGFSFFFAFAFENRFAAEIGREMIFLPFGCGISFFFPHLVFTDGDANDHSEHECSRESESV